MAGAKMHHDRMGKRAGTHLMAAGDDAVVHERFDCQIEFGLGHLVAIDTRDRGLPSAMVGRNEKEPAIIDNQPPGEDIPVLAHPSLVHQLNRIEVTLGFVNHDHVAASQSFFRSPRLYHRTIGERGTTRPKSKWGSPKRPIERSGVRPCRPLTRHFSCRSMSQSWYFAWSTDSIWHRGCFQNRCREIRPPQNDRNQKTCYKCAFLRIGRWKDYWTETGVLNGGVRLRRPVGLLSVLSCPELQ